jgi:hypothetical protein
LLWDTNTDVKRDIEEFHQAFYGKAAPAMMAYFDLLQAVVDLPPNGKGDHFWCCSSPHFSDDFLARAKQLFAQAQAEAENETVRSRVQKAQLSIDYLEFVRAKRFALRDGTYEPADLADVRNRYQEIINQAKRFGITDLGEGKSLDEENKSFTHVKAYQVETLENAALLVHVAPELNGRVIQMIDKRTGHDALLPPDAEAPTYPDVAGLVFSVYDDYVSTKPLEVKWDVAPGFSPAGTAPSLCAGQALKGGATAESEVSESARKNNRLALTGTSAPGLTLNRTIQIPGDGASLHTETVVQNVGNAVIDVVLQSRFDANLTKGLAPEEMDAVRVAFSGQDGKVVEKKLIDPEQEPVGSETYTGKSRPDGEWRLINVETGLKLVNRFPNVQVERCFLRWGAKNQNVVGLVLWSPKRRLAPGESMRLDAEYEIGR